MKLKKAISLFLILVLSIQLLPVKQVVSWLLSGQATEEIVHASDTAKNSFSGEEINKDFLSPNHSYDFSQTIILFTAMQHRAETIIGRHADDVPTPPPNC